MIKVWDTIDTLLMSKPSLSSDRLPTFYPSSASCISDVDGAVVGACLRMNWYRCAGYSKSDPDSLWSQYVFAGGNVWEDWICQKLKEAGVWKGNSVKFVDKIRYISGEVDIIVEDPADGGIVIVEVKTFFGYEGKKKICGNTKIKPTPKDPNLLQAMIYSDQFKDQIKGTILLYFARDDHSRQEFLISSVDHKGKTRPHIDTNYRGAPHAYIDERVSIEGIYERYESLLDHLQKDEMPVADFQHIYSKEEMDAMWAAGTIGKTKYEKFNTNAEKYPCGYFMCQSYCSYRTMCAEHKKERGET